MMAFSSCNNQSLQNGLNTTSSDSPVTELQYEFISILSGISSFLMLVSGGFVIFIILSDTKLKDEFRYALLVNFLVSNISYFCLQTVINIIHSQKVAVIRPLCSLFRLITKTLMGNEIISMSVMALDRCIAICFPFKYYSIFGSHTHKRIFLTLWFLSALQPGIFLISEYTVVSTSLFLCSSMGCYFLDLFPQMVISPDTITAMIYIMFCLLVILVTHILIYCEGKSSGVIHLANIQARKVLLMHFAHMSVYIIPAFTLHMILFPNIFCKIDPTSYSVISLAMFAFFTAGQSVCPLVYGYYFTEIRIACLRKIRLFQTYVAPQM